MTGAVWNTADRWLATLAGRNTWQDAERGITATARALAALQAVSLAATASSLVFVSGQLEIVPSSGWLGAPQIILVLDVLAILVGSVRTALGLISPSRSVVINVVGRAALGIIAAACVFAIAPRWWAMLSWPIGVAIGCDVALTTTAIGWRPSPWQWWASILVSPLHLGIVGGLIGASIARGDNSAFDTAVPIYATLQAWLLVACVTAWVSQKMIDRDAATLNEIRLKTLRDEHRRSAHWLHDDICAQLRLVALKVQSGSLAPGDVGPLLDELDFTLRLRQLDELIESGTVRLAELLQPFLRNAQNHGVAVERVPAYETASAEVDHDTGVSFRRAAAVLTSNALNAGAARIAFDIEVNDEFINLTVTDDAGGFDLSEISSGRGLWSLRHDLGADHLTIERSDAGSSVRVTVPRRTRSSHGIPDAGR